MPYLTTFITHISNDSWVIWGEAFQAAIKLYVTCCSRILENKPKQLLKRRGYHCIRVQPQRWDEGASPGYSKRERVESEGTRWLAGLHQESQPSTSAMLQNNVRQANDYLNHNRSDSILCRTFTIHMVKTRNFRPWTTSKAICRFLQRWTLMQTTSSWFIAKNTKRKRECLRECSSFTTPVEPAELCQIRLCLEREDKILRNVKYVTVSLSRRPMSWWTGCGGVHGWVSRLFNITYSKASEHIFLAAAWEYPALARFLVDPEDCSDESSLRVQRRFEHYLTGYRRLRSVSSRMYEISQKVGCCY